MSRDAISVQDLINAQRAVSHASDVLADAEKKAKLIFQAYAEQTCPFKAGDAIPQNMERSGFTNAGVVTAVSFKASGISSEPCEWSIQLKATSEGVLDVGQHAWISKKVWNDWNRQKY